MSTLALLQFNPATLTFSPSKVQTYMECARKFFYQEILRWERDTPNHNLVFGSAWHLAMEHLLTQGRSAEAIAAAYDRFEKYYREYFSSMTDEQYFPKSPTNVVPTLVEYCAKWRDDQFETLYTEISGSAPVSDSRSMTFRLDGILRHKETGKIVCIEHKTGSQLSEAWREQFRLKVQTGCYTHVLHCIDDSDNVDGVLVNGVLFKKKANDYERVLIRTSPEMMQAWLYTVNFYIEWINSELIALDAAIEDDTVLEAFPMNTESCTRYGICQFHDFCSIWPNPLRHAGDPPIGYRVRPHFDQNSDRPAKFNLTPKGVLEKVEVQQDDGAIAPSGSAAAVAATGYQEDMGSTEVPIPGQ